jgi:hypothetical protein
MQPKLTNPRNSNAFGSGTAVAMGTADVKPSEASPLPFSMVKTTRSPGCETHSNRVSTRESDDILTCWLTPIPSTKMFVAEAMSSSTA